MSGFTGPAPHEQFGSGFLFCQLMMRVIRILLAAYLEFLYFRLAESALSFAQKTGILAYLGETLVN